MQPRKRHDPATKAEALRLVPEVGIAEAARRTGVPVGTVASWAARAGVQAPTAEEMRPLVERLALSVAQKREQLAEALLDDLERLRAQLFAPCVERKVVVLSDGHLTGSHAEIVDVERDKPTFAEQKAIMTTLAIGVDKVLLMTGQATERTEVVTPDRTPEVEAQLATVLELVRNPAA